MTPILFVLPAVIAAVLSFCLVRPVSAIAFRVGAIDLPGPRKIHTEPMPRLGGLAVVIAAFVAFGATLLFKMPRIHMLSSQLLGGIAAGLIPIFLVSFFDDIRSVRPLTRLVMHFLGAGIAVALGNRLPETIDVFGRGVHLGWLAIPISLIWIASVTNAFNIIDGLDGLSAGLALISSASLAAVSLVAGNYEMASACLILAGALIGFLPHNIHPAKIFLGDTGATAIGFVLACLSLSGGSITSSGLAVTLPLLIVGVPLADTIISIIRRIVRKFDGDSSGVFDADRRHIHHRLLALGLNQWRAALTLYGVAAVLALMALLSLFIEQRKSALLLLAILAAAFVGISKLGYDEFDVTRRGALLRIYDFPVLRIGPFVAFIDIVFVVAALCGSMVLKYDGWGIREQILTTQLMALLPPVTIIVFALMRVYRCCWRNANVEDMLRISAATLTAGFVGYIISAMLLGPAVTSTYFVLYTICLFGFVAGSRASYRVLYHWNRRANQHGEPIVIYGAGKSGTMALREIQMNFGVPMSPVGFIDDDPDKRGLLVNGYPVFGTVTALEDLVKNHGIRGVLLATEKIERSKLDQARALCGMAGLWIRRFRVSFQEIFVERRQSDRRQKCEPLSFADRRQVSRRTQSSVPQDLVLETNDFIQYANDYANDSSVDRTSNHRVTPEMPREDRETRVGLHAARAATPAPGLGDGDQPLNAAGADVGAA